jgi:hypothetical protein
MVNHVRTLLLNRETSYGVDDAPGSELTPDYAPPPLSEDMRHVHMALFGSSPDMVYLNYRLKQYLTLLHASPLRTFVTALDPRVSYLGSRPELLKTVWLPTVVQTQGDGNAQLALLGSAIADDATGRSRCQISIEASSSAVQMQQTSPHQARTDLTVSLTSAVELGGSGFRALIRPATGASWTITAYARPRETLTEVAQKLASTTRVPLANLFEGDEPYRTFRNLWHHHPSLPQKLCGAVLALAYRIEAARALTS